MSAKLFALYLLASLLATSSASYAYYKSSSDQNTRSSFTLPVLDSTTIVTALIDLQGAGLSYKVQMWPPLTFPPNAPFQSTTLSGTALFTSNALSVPGSWRLVVVPNSPSDPKFSFTINIFANGNVVGKYVDVARYNRYFTIFHRSAGWKTVSVTVPASFASQVSLNLYGPFQSLTVAGGALQTNTSQQGTISITYSSNPRDYYYLQVVQSSQLTQSGAFINVKYDSEQYSCPYSSEFLDVNGVFMGCSNAVATYGYPCWQYDDTLGTCLACFNGFTLTDGGVCLRDTSCPKGQYFSMGKCYDAIDNCNDFEIIGGKCLSCDTGYTLNNYNNGSQGCTLNLQNCKENQYLLGNTCMNYVDNCANFLTSSGQCLACKAGYNLNGNKCDLIRTASLDCHLGYKETEDGCKPIDPNCIYFYNNNTCMLCASGYQLKKSCELIICGKRQSSSTGSCMDVSPFCNTFDPIFGNCLTCIYNYFLQSDGSCLQSIPTQAGVMTTNSCPVGYYMRKGTCVVVNPLCLTFDVNSGFCTSCLDTSYFLNNAGACILISEFCGYRTYFSNGNCLPVSNLCDTYDSTSGYCLSCRDSTILTDKGTCVFNDPCQQRQYRAANGTCLNVSEACDTYNPSNGWCLTCKQNHEMNEGGVCCYTFNYMLDQTACTPLYATNCQTQHDRFKYCLKCNPGYDATHKPFGRCNPLPTSSQNSP